VLLLTAGTGIGSALFYGGRLVPNTEFGHVPVKGRPGEKFFSAAAKTRRRLGWREWATGFGGYVRILERLLSPELIIIGGGVSAEHRKWFKYLKLRAPVRPAKLHNEAGIVGAALAANRGR
jgi:polyphosphate glucokinase